MNAYNHVGDDDIISIHSDDEIISIHSDGDEESIQIWEAEPRKGKSWNEPIELDCIEPIVIQDDRLAERQRQRRRRRTSDLTGPANAHPVIDLADSSDDEETMDSASRVFDQYGTHPKNRKSSKRKKIGSVQVISRQAYHERRRNSPQAAFFSSTSHGTASPPSARTVADPVERSQSSIETVTSINDDLGPPAPPLPASHSLEDFLTLWSSVEHEIDKTATELDQELRHVLKKSETTGQSAAQYGRLLPEATDWLFRKHLELKKSDVFVDIGSGVANAPLQAAYTIGCAARGIEISGERHYWAEKFILGLEKKGVDLSHCEIIRGRMEVPKHRHFLTGDSGKRVVKALCNNFNENFGEKAKKLTDQYTLDQYVAGLFSCLAAGSKLVTLYPLPMYTPPFDDSNKKGERGGLLSDNSASYYTLKKEVLGKQNECVSWSEGNGCQNGLEIFIYTRVGGPYFSCPCSTTSTSLPASEITFITENGREQERCIENHCRSCNITPKQLRGRKNISYREPSCDQH